MREWHSWGGQRDGGGVHPGIGDGGWGWGGMKDGQPTKKNGQVFWAQNIVLFIRTQSSTCTSAWMEANMTNSDNQHNKTKQNKTKQSVQTKKSTQLFGKNQRRKKSCGLETWLQSPRKRGSTTATPPEKIVPHRFQAVC